VCSSIQRQVASWRICARFATVASLQAKNSQAGPIALLGVRAVGQDRLDERGSLRPHGLSPAHQPRRAPLYGERGAPPACAGARRLGGTLGESPRRRALAELRAMIKRGTLWRREARASRYGQRMKLFLRRASRPRDARDHLRKFPGSDAVAERKPIVGFSETAHRSALLRRSRLTIPLSSPAGVRPSQVQGEPSDRSCRPRPTLLPRPVTRA
jgi:hypothetical protein